LSKKKAAGLFASYTDEEYYGNMNSKIAAITLISAIFALSVLSFFSMQSIGHDGAHDCPLSFLSKPDCVPEGSLVGTASHHLSRVLDFTVATPSLNFLQLVVSVFLLVLLLVLTRQLRFLINLKNNGIVGTFARILVEIKYRTKVKLFSWLEILRKLQASSVVRVHNYA